MNLRDGIEEVVMAWLSEDYENCGGKQQRITDQVEVFIDTLTDKSKDWIGSIAEEIRTDVRKNKDETMAGLLQKSANINAAVLLEKSIK